MPEFTAADHNGNTEPVAAYPAPEQRQELDRLQSDIAAALIHLPEKELVAQENRWSVHAADTIPTPPKDGLRGYYEFEHTLEDSSGQGHDARLAHGESQYVNGAVGQAAFLSGSTAVDFGNIIPFDRTTPFAASFWTNLRWPRVKSLLQERDASPNWTGWEITFDDPLYDARLMRIVVRLASHWPNDAIEVHSKERVLHSQFVDIRELGTAGQHLVLTYDGSGKAAGVKLYLDGKPIETEIIKDQLTGSSRTSHPLSVGDDQLGTPFVGTIDELRVYNRMLSQADVDNLHEDAVASALARTLRGKPVVEIPLLREGPPPRDFSDDDPSTAVIEAVRLKRQQAQLSDYFLSHAASEPFRATYVRLKELRARKAALEKVIPTSMVMAEMDQPMDTFVLGRGQFYNKLEKVTAGVPGFLLQPPPNAPTNRLTLARWLVDPRNPLTARVEVNRYWQHFFGTGIVKTAEDFGAQGERPSHPQLLDWLATEFMRTGWDIKAMQRLIALSATYRQASKSTPKLQEIDPENRLLARGPRVRLAAEEIRDSALAVSGLLVEKIGGPSEYPYQPPGLWTEHGSEGASYQQSSGPGLYRRSLYTIWRRSTPQPSMVAFDVPDREFCVARRLQTNTPLQALVLMNDPTYVEASRLFAQRALLEAGKDERKRIEFLFGWTIERQPNSKERALILREARSLLARFRESPDTAQQLLVIGETPADPRIDPAELAAWTQVARTVMNMDEVITNQ